jgi:hypothetical protein
VLSGEGVDEGMADFVVGGGAVEDAEVDEGADGLFEVAFWELEDGLQEFERKRCWGKQAEDEKELLLGWGE